MPLVTGGPSLIDQLKVDETLMSNASAKQGVQDMELLFTFLRAYNVIDKVRPSTSIREQNRLASRSHLTCLWLVASITTPG